jgi:hypothetical protein
MNRKHAAQLLETKKCPYCTSGNGEKKDIYNSPEEAFQRAEYIKEIRGISLDVYRCEYGNGWHLTKNDSSNIICSRRSGMLVRNDIPLMSVINGGVSWEYIEDTTNDGVPAENKFRLSLPDYKKPIVRIENKAGGGDVSLNGKVIEILKDANIEKIFNLNLENIISANLAKEFTGEPHQQITIHVENIKAGRIDSYTVLIKKSFMRRERIKKGSAVNIVLSGKCINKTNVWSCRVVKAAL